MCVRFLTRGPQALCTLICLLVVGCTGPPPVSFPDTDIVYETGLLKDAKLGFINADGSNSSLLAVVDDVYLKPVWSSDGNTLYVLRWNGGPNSGEVIVWRGGKSIRACQNADFKTVYSIDAIVSDDDSIQALVNNANRELLLIDLDHCKEVRKYLDLTSTPSRFIEGASLTSDGKQIVYAEVVNRQAPNAEYVIKALDIDSGETYAIGKGIEPSLSPDGNWIVYVWLDGIYMMAADGSQGRRLVEYDVTGRVFLNDFAVLPPVPRWSPDGKWLIYHRCDAPRDKDCGSRTEYSIFKLEVATGTEIKIVDNGVYPFWRDR